MSRPSLAISLAQQSQTLGEIIEELRRTCRLLAIEVPRLERNPRGTCAGRRLYVASAALTIRAKLARRDDAHSGLVAALTNWGDDALSDGELLAALKLINDQLERGNR